MDAAELEQNVKEFAYDLNIDTNRCRPIPKNKLVVGQEYIGNCRNATKAIWKGEYFVYLRYKFGDEFYEKINHYEDDDGYDVFVPIEVI